MSDPLREKVRQILHRWQASFVGQFARPADADREVKRELCALLADVAIEQMRSHYPTSVTGKPERYLEDQIRLRWGVQENINEQ